jgi:alpha-ketoglutarate-dependent taurine dioxygenase
MYRHYQDLPIEAILRALQSDGYCIIENVDVEDTGRAASLLCQFESALGIGMSHPYQTGPAINLTDHVQWDPHGMIPPWGLVYRHPHTIGAALRNPPAFVAWMCISAPAHGGELLLLDIAAAAASLNSTLVEDLFHEEAIRIEQGLHDITAPVLRHDRFGATHARFTVHRGTRPGSHRSKVAVRALGNLVRDPLCHLAVPLRPGTLVIVRNGRIGVGNTAMLANDGLRLARRWLSGNGSPHLLRDFTTQYAALTATA